LFFCTFAYFFIQKVVFFLSSLFLLRFNTFMLYFYTALFVYNFNRLIQIYRKRKKEINKTRKQLYLQTANIGCLISRKQEKRKLERCSGTAFSKKWGGVGSQTERESTKISTTKVEFFLVATHFITRIIRIFVG